MVRITDHHDMTSAVDCGRKASTNSINKIIMIRGLLSAEEIRCVFDDI